MLSIWHLCFSIGNFCHRKWVLPNSVTIVVVYGIGLCFAWKGCCISCGRFSATGLQCSLKPGSLQLYLFHLIQKYILVFTLRWMSWLHPRTELSQDFETLNLFFSKHTQTCPLVSMQNWRHSPNETPAYIFLLSFPVLRGRRVGRGKWDLIAGRNVRKAGRERGRVMIDGRGEWIVYGVRGGGQSRRVGERRKISLAQIGRGHSLQIRNERKTGLRTQAHQNYCGMHQSTSSDAEFIFPGQCCTKNIKLFSMQNGSAAWWLVTVPGREVMFGLSSRRCFSFLQLKLKLPLWSTRPLLPVLWLPPHRIPVALTT